MIQSHLAWFLRSHYCRTDEIKTQCLNRVIIFFVLKKKTQLHLLNLIERWQSNISFAAVGVKVVAKEAEVCSLGIISTSLYHETP